MIEAYLHNIDELLSTNAVVRDAEVMRRSIRDTNVVTRGRTCPPWAQQRNTVSPSYSCWGGSILI